MVLYFSVIESEMYGHRMLGGTYMKKLISCTFNEYIINVELKNCVYTDEDLNSQMVTLKHDEKNK